MALLNKISDSGLSSCPVNSHTEWDPLEEVIVGRLDYAMFAEWRGINDWTVPPGEWQAMEDRMGGGGVPYLDEMKQAAQRDLDGFIHILEAEGVTVRRPDIFDFSAGFQTPAWSSSSGFSAANPRDPFLVIGNEIIETPMADRARYFESWPYRTLFMEYFRAGAKWTAAPKPRLTDEQYKQNFQPDTDSEAPEFVLTEFEPVFDAADFVRCGRDIFCQTSHVTNRTGVEWLQRHLGDDYRIHLLQSRSPEAIHIDTTFMPLAPGKVLVNPEYIDISKLPSVLKSWDILEAPEPAELRDPLCGVSPWISINILMLDEQRIIVEKRQERLIKALKDWGFTPVPISFESYYPFLGSVHCATLDVRRRGELKSWF